ncbi:MAG TPA: DNA/RNA non-specific endonuclease [Chitinophaga sp.]|uniref:DNA/RNA non-specific endonuclease n=1 Tax=Chitinophaga sp. TaxID=1869181 RepID=UPI002F92E2DB
MPLESSNAVAARTSSPAAANKHRSAGISRPAVQPVQAMLANKNGEDAPFQVNDERTAATRAFSLPVENDRREPSDIRPFQLKPAGSTAPPVVQREPLTKEKIFNDQIKWLVVQGIARMTSTKSGSEGGKQFAILLESKDLINSKKLSKAYTGNKKNQGLTLKEEKDNLLSEVTLVNLQRHNLVMQAVAFADVAEGKWEIYRPDIKKAKTAQGLGGETDEVQSQQVRTSIKWESTIHDQGQGVTAEVLGPDHPLGSTPNNAIKENVDDLKIAAGGKKYVAGHLLNHNLGGPGNNAKNLMAIPADVNSEMSTQVEDDVIERVNKEHQVVYYKVDVEYGRDGKKNYASRISIEFGSYKSGTDFSQADPDIDLEEKHTFVLPVRSPTAYGRKPGYKRTGDPGQYIYKDQSKEPYPWKKPDKANDPALLKFDRMNNIVLKDDKQIKLEFIAAAIYSSSIRELKEEVDLLSGEKDIVKGELSTLQSKYEKLKAEAKKNAVLEEQLNILTDQFQKESKERLEAEGENEALKKEVGDMKARIDTVNDDLKKEELLVKELQVKLSEYMKKARERAVSEGFVEGLNDGKKGIIPQLENRIKIKKISLGSEPNFSGGYKQGHQVGRELAQQEEENRRLRDENEEQKTLIFELKTEKQELHEELGRTRVMFETEREEWQREREASRKREEELIRKLGELQKEKESLQLMKETIRPVTEQLQEENKLLESERKMPERHTNEEDRDKIRKEKKVPESKMSTSGQLDTSEVVDKDSRIKKLFEGEFEKHGSDGWQYLGIEKYKYLSILVYLGTIKANAAYEAYRRNDKYYDYFYKAQVRQSTYQEFKKQYK